MSGIERIRHTALREKVMPAEQAAAFIKNGMTVAFGNFLAWDNPVSIAKALCERVKLTGEPMKLDMIACATLRSEIDDAWTEAGFIRSRRSFQQSGVMREQLNRSDGIEFYDPHMSRFPELIRQGCAGDIDLLIFSATGVTEDGGLIPTMCTGFSPSLIKAAKRVLIEVNTNIPESIGRLHDVFVPDDCPDRRPIEILSPGDRIGESCIRCEPERIAGIVISNEPVRRKTRPADNEVADCVAEGLIRFLRDEVRAGKMSEGLLPMQIGLGSMADAVLRRIGSEFSGLSMYSEVLQDGALELIDAGRIVTASTGGLSLSSLDCCNRFLSRVDEYVGKLIIRPSEITNQPEVIRRLGVMAINNAVEADIYGNVNSTHAMGTRMLNGIGGAGDFARNARLSIFTMQATTAGGDISRIVPMCSHTDHPSQDVGVIATEYGVADLRLKSPREKAREIISKTACPDYRDMLWDYYNRAVELCDRDGRAHTPHILSEALSWHSRYLETGTMKP